MELSAEGIAAERADEVPRMFQEEAVVFTREGRGQWTSGGRTSI